LLAKSFGLTVVALSRSAEKGARLKELGADFVFNPLAENLHAAVSAALAPKKVDLAVDNVGGPLFNEVIAMLGLDGRMSVVGRSGGVVPEFNTATLFSRRVRIGGVAVGAYTAEGAQDAWKQIITRLDIMRKRPIVDSVFAFEDLKEAFARLSRAPMGKVLLRIAK
jgi:NADPH2:quinone reductase